MKELKEYWPIAVGILLAGMYIGKSFQSSETGDQTMLRIEQTVNEKVDGVGERLSASIVRLLEENQGGRSDQERADDCLNAQQDLKNEILYYKLKYESEK